jgi:hypothetical protein
MSNANQPWRKFTQTFFLAEQPNGYFVLNDIFRYLKEESDEEEEEPLQDEPASVAAVPAPVQEEVASEPAAPVAVQEEIKVVEEAQPEPTPEPEPATALDHPEPANVPAEAVVTAVPDKDIALTEVPAVEEPTTATNPPIEEPAEVVAASSPAPPAPVLPNGNPSPAVAPPTPAATPAKPAVPKTWASLAAAAGSRSNPAAAPAVTVAPTPAAKKEDAALATPAATPVSAPATRHPFYENALKVQTPHCFVKVCDSSPDQNDD